HPLLSLLVLPLFLLYYLSVGLEHRFFWHAPLLVGLFVAVAANSFWLYDWVGYWWIRVPPSCEAAPLPSLRAFWQSPSWGGGLDRALACLLVLAGAVGVVLLHRNKQRICARLLGLGTVGFLALALAGSSWEPFARFGATQLLTTALLFAALPSALALSWGV